MLERFFLKPQTVDRILGCWLGQNIELYAAMLIETGYSARSLLRRVPILVQFANFTDAMRIHEIAQAESVIERFVDHWLSTHNVGASTILRQRERSLARCTVRHFYSLIVWKSDYRKRKTLLLDPFLAEAPGFFTYLREERGLRPETLYQYRHHLRRFAVYLDRIGCADLRVLSLPIVTGFITTTAREINYSVMVGLASSVRVFLRYLRREGVLHRDISQLVEIPQRYRLVLQLRIYDDRDSWPLRRLWDGRGVVRITAGMGSRAFASEGAPWSSASPSRSARDGGRFHRWSLVEHGTQDGQGNRVKEVRDNGLKC